jgi:hypothetical protein
MALAENPLNKIKAEAANSIAPAQKSIYQYTFFDNNLYNHQI